MGVSNPLGVLHPLGVSHPLVGSNPMNGLDPVGISDPLSVLEPVIDFSTSTKYFTILTPSLHHHSDLISLFAINFVMFVPITKDSLKTDLQ